jgi:hypothetical protein
MAEHSPLSGVEKALENRLLDTLAVVRTELGNLAQSSFSLGSLGIDVVSDEYQHLGYLQKKAG